MILAVRPVFAVRGVRNRRHDSLDFRHGNRWQVSAEQQEQRQEYAKTSKEHQSVKHGWPEVAPRARQKIPAQRCNRNHESFKPHSDIHENANHNHPKS